MSEVWRIAAVAPASAAPLIERALEPFADVALSVLDADPRAARRPGEPQPATWQSDVWLAEMCVVEALSTGRPDGAAVSAALAVAAAAAAIPAPTARIEPVAARDWLAETYRAFPEIAVGRYRVRGSHIAGLPRPGAITIMIDAATAFGTGEHETTRGCLEAVDRLGRQLRPSRVLDMGCGSGILAIAAAKTWPCPVVASDIDPRAAAVARRNMRINGVSARVLTMRADGYRARAIAATAPYELVLSNILARPLARLAPDLRRHLAPGGIAVLAGFLSWQEPYVLAAHRAQGLRLLFRIAHGDWTTVAVRG